MCFGDDRLRRLCDNKDKLFSSSLQPKKLLVISKARYNDSKWY